MEDKKKKIVGAIQSLDAHDSDKYVLLSSDNGNSQQKNSNAEFESEVGDNVKWFTEPPPLLYLV